MAHIFSVVIQFYYTFMKTYIKGAKVTDNIENKIFFL